MNWVPVIHCSEGHGIRQHALLQCERTSQDQEFVEAPDMASTSVVELVDLHSDLPCDFHCRVSKVPGTNSKLMQIGWICLRSRKYHVRAQIQRSDTLF